jgi:hypothetical protein
VLQGSFRPEIHARYPADGDLTRPGRLLRSFRVPAVRHSLLDHLAYLARNRQLVAKGSSLGLVGQGESGLNTESSEGQSWLEQ